MTTTSPIAIATITKNNNINHNNNNNSFNSTSSAKNQTPSVQQQQHHPTDSFNASVKSIFRKTLTQVHKANLSEFATQYSELPPFIAAHGSTVGGIGSTGSELSATLAADMVTAAATTLPAIATRHLAETTTIAFPVQTVATFIAGNKNRATTIIVYPTVSPESIVIPIVSCIFGFPILALIVICCLRRRAKLARERDRRRNYDMQDHAVSLVRFSPIHRLSNYRSSRAISLRPERSLSQGFASLELDTVVEERSDIEQTQTEILNAESPQETTSYKLSFSS